MSPRNLNTSTQTDQQRAENQERQDNIDAIDGGQEDAQIADGYAADEISGNPDTTIQEAREARKPIQRSPQDDARLAIAARFTRNEDRPFDGDFTKPENLYGEVADPPAEEVEDESSIVGEPVQQAAPPADQPRMITRKVRGQDVTLSEDQWLERAMKVTAADSYLEESRKLLEEAERIKAERAGRDPQHPEGRSSTQDDGQDGDRSDGLTQHPESETKAIVEKIQFGDPDEAAVLLDQLIDKRAGKRAEEGHVERLFNNDLAKSQKALKDFRDANPELDNDKIAAQIIEANMYEIYREELLSLGLDEAKLPKTNAELANWHRLQRVHGFAVSDTPKLLNEAKERLNKWRGTSIAPKPAVPAAKPAPRLEVNVNRTERRAAIPNQPNRASLPPPRAAAAPQKSTGSDVVNEMRRARGQFTV